MKVFITTSGIGSRLLELTKYTNKSMIKIGKKPVISYIIDEYPDDTEFVISLGYFGDHVRQFLKLAYPEKKITLVEVDKYDGPGSSQVYSQLQAEPYLQEPFIYHDCDTIISNLQDQIPMDFDYNFLVGYETNSELYDAFDYDTNTRMSGKFEAYNLIRTYMKPDSLVGMLAFVGICGIYDYKTFWKYMHLAYENEKVPYDFLVYHKYGMFANDLKAIKVDNWIDTGNIAGVKNARKTCKDKFFILDKNDQGIFVINNKVIKFFAQDGVVDQLLRHYETIKEFCQPITEHAKNFFCYDFIDAENAIDRMNSVRFKKMMEDLKAKRLWELSPLEVDKEKMDRMLREFYIDKNLERVNRFKEFYKVSEDKDIYVNDILIPKEWTIENMLNAMASIPEWKDTRLTKWHGDFVLDNMLYDPQTDKYVLLDWRPKFVKELTKYGDRNYDFAKMNHNLTFNFNSACNDLFTINESDPQDIHVNILCNNAVHDCRSVLKEFIEQNFVERFEYIEFITGICWASMSPLYFLNPVSKFLFYLGKLTMYINLMKLLGKKNEIVTKCN